MPSGLPDGSPGPRYAVRMGTRLIIATLALLLTPGCFLSKSHVNSELDATIMESLIPGQSTADDVLGLLGAPMDVVQLWNRSAWRYDHTQTKDSMLILVIVNFGKTDSKQDRVWVFFDANDVVTHIGGTFEANQVEWGLPF